MTRALAMQGTRDYCKVHYCIPCRSMLESVGFSFDELQSDAYYIGLPKNWHFRLEEDEMYILDNYERERGCYYHDEKNGWTLLLYTRFNCLMDMNEEKEEYTLYLCDSLAKKWPEIEELQDGGYLKIKSISKEDSLSQIHEDMDMAKKMLAELYPNWENPLAYWDE